MTTVVYGHFEWDSRKNLANRVKHSLSFEAAVEIFQGIVLEIPADGNFGEERAIAIGKLESKEILVVYTERIPRRRIISARRAKKHEREAYQEFLQKIHDS